jgi:HAD superfamily hydrolase (TIGR01549 family)
MLIDTVVFDLDGTLIESHINYERMGQLIKNVLVKYGMTEPLEDRRKIYRVIRGGKSTLIEFGHPIKNMEQTLIEMEKVMNLVELEALPTILPKPNALKTLTALNEAGFKLGIATRSHHEYAKQCLNKTRMDYYFDRIVARDDVPWPKPDPRHLLHTIDLLESKQESTLYIGDTTTDLTTANAAKVRFIGYKRDDVWAQRLIDAGCKFIIEDLYDIISVAMYSN